MTEQRFDFCFASEEQYIRNYNGSKHSRYVSDHNYYYAAGFGDALSIRVKYGVHNSLYEWQHGTAYNYGIGKPHYPVPAKLLNADIAASFVCAISIDYTSLAGVDYRY